jgi:hypothetical protein
VVSSLPALATQAEFATIAGVQRSYVTALKKAGRLVLDADGKVRVVESLARIEATRDPSKAAVAARHAEARGGALPAAAEPLVSAAPPEVGGGADRLAGGFQQARAVREKFLALEAKRAYEVAMGRLIDAGEVRIAVADAAARLRVSLESLPNMIGPQLAAESDEARCVAVLRDAVELTLEELSRQFQAIAPGVPR